MRQPTLPSAGYANAGLFLVLSVLWGTAFVAISAGLEHLPPVLFAGIRYDIAGIIVLGYAVFVTDGWWPRTFADWLTVAVGATLVIALYNALLFIGQQTVTSGVAAILVATSPILTTGFSRLFLSDERLSRIGVLGLTLGFVGVGLVVYPDPEHLLSADVVAAGFVLGASVSVGLGSVLVQRIDANLPAESMVAWSCVFGAILLHGLSGWLPTESLRDLSFTPGAIVSVVYLAVFASAIGYVIYFTMLERVGAIEINLVSYVVPVVATAFGWLVLSETIELTTVLGFVIITAGFALLKLEALTTLVRSVLARG